MIRSPQIGARISHGWDIGTVRFIGTVEGSLGDWLGIEWDDPRRGKHDGVKGDKRYFSCMTPNAGSFLRPTVAGLIHGTSFLKALSSKYVEALHASAQTEKVTLGSSNGAIEVEAVNLDKVRARLSQLDMLREVSLDNQGVALPDPLGRIKETCPGVRGLDLSRSLIPSWDVLALITSELDFLERLAVNQNRLALPPHDAFSLMDCAFRNLKELQMNATLITWPQCRIITSYMPLLELVEVGYNGLQELSVESSGEVSLPAHAHPLANNQTLQTVNFDGNYLTSWARVCRAMQPLLSLERLILSSNQIEAIDRPPPPTTSALASPIHSLKHLAITFNRLHSWSDIDHLPYWCPNLVSLKMTGNPLSEVGNTAKYAREFTIAKMGTLEVLDAGPITPNERADCERFYLSWIVKNELHDDEETRYNKHPRWRVLCQIHGKPDDPTPKSLVKQDTLGSRLLQISVRQLHSQRPPPFPLTTTTSVLSSPCSSSSLSLSLSETATSVRVLPSMAIRTLRLKLAKVLKLKASKAEVGEMRLWLVLPDTSLSEIRPERETDDLAWWGVEDGSEIVVSVSSAS